jgi:hypothetical protein
VTVNGEWVRIWKEVFMGYLKLLSADLAENPQSYYEIRCVLLPVCMVATSVKVMYKYCSRVFGCNLNPYYQFFFLNYMSIH